MEAQDARKSQANKTTCKTRSQIPYCLHKPECIGTTKPNRSVLITILTWQFPFNPVNVSNLHVKGTFVRGSLFPLLRHVVPLNDGNCRLTIHVIKGRCIRGALPHAFNIGIFKYGKSNPIFTTNLRTWMKVVTLLLTAIIGGIFNKQCEWLAWRVW